MRPTRSWTMVVVALVLLGIAAAGCRAVAGSSAPAVEPVTTNTPIPSPSPSSEASRPTTVPTPTPIPPDAEPTPCALSPVVVPTVPAEVPGYTELDESTGLHMTGRVQEIDLEAYRLAVTGKVDTPLTLTYDDLRCMPKVSAAPALVCPGFFEDHATWAGAPLAPVLEAAGLQDGATQLRLISADGYSALVPLEDALSDDNFLAYEWEGQPLPILHGFPVRAVFPGLQGNRWVKWLVEIEVH